MRWNIDNIGFLHQPEDFLGSFDNDKMQLKHEQQVRLKLEKMKSALHQEKNALKAMLLLNSRDHVQFLQNNMDVFLADGEFEAAVLKLYRKKNGPFSTPNDIETWSAFFRRCNKQKLYDRGEPLSFSQATVYRGATIGSARSLSWSPDRKRALWYAERWKDPDLGGGKLFQVEIAAADLLVYLTDKHEEEIILTPDFIETAAIQSFSADA
jgi:hypothetical protein